MTVKNLIMQLLDYDMDTTVCVGVDKEHYNSDGEFCKGYLFDVNSVGDFSSVIELKFDIGDLDIKENKQ